jgi:hypothetical protein
VDLFSVACITCRAKIKVQSMSAIGEVLACPRCGAFVEITPPPGWKPPAEALKPKPEKRLPEKRPPDKPKPAPAASTIPVAGTPPALAGDKSSHAKPTAEPKQPAEPKTPAASPSPAAAPDASAAVPQAYVAEAVLDDAPLAEALRLGVERERKQRKMLLVAVAVAGVVLVPIGLWSFFKPSPGDVAQSSLATEPGPAASASGTATSPSATPQPGASPTAAPPAASSASVPPAAATASPPSPPVPAPTANPLSTPLPADTPIPSAAPVPTGAATPTGTATPSATALAKLDPPKSPPAAPPASPPIGPAAPRASLPPAAPEVTARIATKAPALDFAGVPRRTALEIVGKLAGSTVQCEWDSLSPTELKLAEPVTLKLGDATYAEAFAKLLDPVGARIQVVGSGILIRGALHDARPVAVEYPIDDLAGGDAASAELYAGLVQLFVDPASWDSRGGDGKLEAQAGKLIAVQPPLVQRELAAWLDRLRAARFKSTKGPKPSLETRLATANRLLTKPVTMNFQPAVPLPAILAHLEKTCDATIMLDFVALAEAGVGLDVPMGIAGDKVPLVQVLTAVCESRELGWRIVDERTVEITTREALRRRGYVEFYDVKPLLSAELSPTDLIAQLRAELPDLAWLETGGDGVVRFDSASNRLIVRQHQDAHLKIERFLAARTPGQPGPAAVALPGALNPPPAAVNPAPAPAATASGTAKPVGPAAVSVP